MTTPYEISTPPIPVGTISYYIINGITSGGKNTTDPNGWVICDGQTRTVTDGRYAAIAPLLNTYLGVITNNANSIKPPDYRSRFLYGQASTGNNTISNGGMSLTNLLESNIPPLDITFAETPHSHEIATYLFNLGGPNTDTICDPIDLNGATPAFTTNESTADSTFSYVNAITTALQDPPKATVTYIIKY